MNQPIKNAIQHIMSCSILYLRKSEFRWKLTFFIISKNSLPKLLWRSDTSQLPLVEGAGYMVISCENLGRLFTARLRNSKVSITRVSLCCRIILLYFFSKFLFEFHFLFYFYHVECAKKSNFIHLCLNTFFHMNMQIVVFNFRAKQISTEHSYQSLFKVCTIITSWYIFFRLFL